MAIAELYSGTEAVSTTEWSLSTDTAGPDADTTDGIFQIVLDLNDMVLGDLLRVRFYEKARSGDTQRKVYEAYLHDVQTQPLWASPALVFLHGWDVTLEALAGTVTVLWSVRQVS